MDIYGHTKEFMIILERTTSTAFYAHLVSSLKKWFYWLRQGLYSSWLMFNNLKKTNENHDEKKFIAADIVLFQ